MWGTCGPLEKLVFVFIKAVVARKGGIWAVHEFQVCLSSGLYVLIIEVMVTMGHGPSSASMSFLMSPKSLCS